MSTQALNDAKTWLEVLHDAEFRGRKDTDGAARYRLAKRLGVKENYLFRLQYRAAEMRDVAGEVYRRLGLAYEEICERNEKAADAYRAERLDLRKTNAVDQKPASAGLGKGALGD
ncbi:MAG: hypothetical protein E5X53_28225 [Mesorhizobium sp.]|nr:MAG: hypothetical protein E5X55_27925 [Mesorhizobium sp.]TIQ06783.1 MAG: hypothetical protein E5X57_24145 [Mesorhizobium sp.]TIR48655.1 MAG: hypothetical protein E5X53_28225 [Mesorhizobium sp.]TJV94708.1 MAG: hypothetical protein E5X52_27910 [Mesorhizobium sp.]